MRKPASTWMRKVADDHHRHKNNGPKFGIRLLSNNECRSVQSLAGISQQNMTDLLHIPTPWHNTACQIQNDPTLYIIKSHIVLEALRSKRYMKESGFRLSRDSEDTSRYVSEMSLVLSTRKSIAVSRNKTSPLGKKHLFLPMISIQT